MNTVTGKAITLDAGEVIALDAGEVIILDAGEKAPSHLVEISKATAALLELIEEGPHERGAALAVIARYRIADYEIKNAILYIKQDGLKAPISGGVAVSYLLKPVKARSLRPAVWQSGSNFEGRRKAEAKKAKKLKNKLAQARRKKAR